LIEQCRAEWRRLGVPESIVDEMAVELACDIREAEVDGVSVEALLGSSASDPRAFAASWATERGVVRMRRVQADGRRGRLALVAFTGVASMALIVAVLLLATGEPKLALVMSGAARHAPGSNASFVPPAGRVQASAAAPIEWILLFLALVALAFSGWLWRWGRSRPPIAPAP
jgi:hypothetical protein